MILHDAGVSVSTIDGEPHSNAWNINWEQPSNGPDGVPWDYPLTYQPLDVNLPLDWQDSLGEDFELGNFVPDDGDELTSIDADMIRDLVSSSQPAYSLPAVAQVAAMTPAPPPEDAGDNLYLQYLTGGNSNPVDGLDWAIEAGRYLAVKTAITAGVAAGVTAAGVGSSVVAVGLGIFGTGMAIKGAYDTYQNWDDLAPQEKLHGVVDIAFDLGSAVVGFGAKKLGWAECFVGDTDLWVVRPRPEKEPVAAAVDTEQFSRPAEIADRNASQANRAFERLALAGMIAFAGAAGSWMILGERKRPADCIDDYFEHEFGDSPDDEDDPLDLLANDRVEFAMNKPEDASPITVAEALTPIDDIHVTLEPTTPAIEHAPPAPSNDRRLFAGLWASACFVLAGLCLLPDAPNSAPHEATPAVATVDHLDVETPSEDAFVSTATAQPTITGERDALPPETLLERIKIRDALLGMRSVGRNPDRSEVDDSIPDPDPETWREVRLAMLKESGDRLRIELLRPLDWIADNVASVGSTVHLDLEEMGAAGPATVTYVGPCPPIQEGPGNVVTGRFIHESAGNLLNLRLDGETAPVGVTANHPYWSVDRQAFVEAGHLQIGEQVDTLAGIRAIASIVPRPIDEAVYNLEIHREHVYRVGASGTLVHNKCVLTRYSVDGGHHIFAKRAFKGNPAYDSNAALAIGQSELSRLGLKHLGSNSITTTQQRLFRELSASGRPNTLSEHARIARQSLVEHGVDSKDAAIAVQKALDQLKSWGISAPNHIPWGG